MRHAAFSLAVVLSSSALMTLPAYAGEPLSQHDREYAMSAMHASRKQFLDSVANLSAAQWNFKAGPDRWSIAECAEHIATSESFIWGLVTKMAADPASKPEDIEKTKGKKEQILKIAPDRSQKFQAPEPIKPKKLSANPQEYVDRFRKLRDEHIHYIETTQDSLLDKVMPHPAAGPLNAYQWILLIAGHSERHVLQILEVKASPGFPAK